MIKEGTQWVQLEAFELNWRRMKNSFLKKQDLKDRLELDKKKKKKRRQSRKDLETLLQ